MIRTIAIAAGMLTLAAVAAQANSGVFVIGGDVGHAHHIGSVARGSRIVVDITAKQSGLDLTCPLKVTLVFLADNNGTALQRRTFRRNSLESRVLVPTVPISGEVVLFIQTQNINHLCNITFSASQDGTVPFALGLSETSETETGDFETNPPPDVPAPVNPVAARQSGLP